MPFLGNITATTSLVAAIAGLGGVYLTWQGNQTTAANLQYQTRRMDEFSASTLKHNNYVQKRLDKGSDDTHAMDRKLDKLDRDLSMVTTDIKDIKAAVSKLADVGTTDSFLTSFC